MHTPPYPYLEYTSSGDVYNRLGLEESLLLKGRFFGCPCGLRQPLHQDQGLGFRDGKLFEGKVGPHTLLVTVSS
ncbi:uncharacterized protein METZ01_LOCUS404528, partial [marine metagenome]